MPEIIQDEPTKLFNDVTEGVRHRNMKNNDNSATGDYGPELTFHPRVSSASARIVEGLGTDFLGRQQRHVEKQKKMMDESTENETEQTKRVKLSEPAENLLPRPKTGEEFGCPRLKLRSRLQKRQSENGSAAMSTPPLLPPRAKTYYPLPPGGVARKRMSTDPYANMDRLQCAKAKAEKAIKNKKIFSIHGCYPLIRQALRERGWVEKEFKMPQRKVKEKSESSDDDDDYDDDDNKDSSSGASPRTNQETINDDPDNKYGIMGRMVRNEVPSFQWTTRTASIDWKFLQKEQIVNHFSKANFTTKVGLCLNLRNITSFAECDIAEFFPRCYLLSNEEDKYDFIDDFRLTAAMSILKIVLARHLPEEPTASKHDTEIGVRPYAGGSHVVPQHVLLCALRACELFVRERNHDDIEGDSHELPISDESWNELLLHYYKLAHEGASVAHSGTHFARCESALMEIGKLRPQSGIDGCMNTWIVKPGAKSRGRGILLYNKLDEILKIVQCDPNLMKDGRWVIQKYIERPLMVYGTKFDIRQWFLVTDWNPMTIYMYKESYLRFSGKPFTLRNLDPAIHLCNYSVQKHYEVDSKRHPLLPSNNMWACSDFKNYLKSRGCDGLWENKIYPGMRKAVIHICQTAQDVVEYRKNSFELYGADFMIDENYHPWLIEVNSSPTMSRSTEVTSRLCASVQEDTLKIVLDRKRDRSCSIGKFELMHKQPVVDVPLYAGKTILVEGSTIRKPNTGNTRRSIPANNTLSNQENTPPSNHHSNKTVKSFVPSHHTAPTAYTAIKNHVKNNVKNVSNGALSGKSNNSSATTNSSTTRLLSERSTSPVKLKMQTTMKRLANETQITPKKSSGLNLPRFSSQSSVNQLPPSTSQNNSTVHSVVNRTVEMINKSTSTAKMNANVHYVSTQHAKSASNQGILPSTVNNYNGLTAAVNRGSIHVKPGQFPHHQVIPKTFPSVVPGGDVVAGGNSMVHPAVPPGVVAVTPQTLHLGLPLQRLLGNTPRVHPQNHFDIYSYTSHQDFRGVARQRLSGIYEWLQGCSENDKEGSHGFEISGCRENANCRNVGTNTEAPSALGSLYIPLDGDKNPKPKHPGFHPAPKLKLHLYHSKSFNKMNKLNTTGCETNLLLNSKDIGVLVHKKSQKLIRSRTQSTARYKKCKSLVNLHTLGRYESSLHGTPHTFTHFTACIKTQT